jgi:DNA-binding MarR family transcriptional regulator
MASFDTLSPQEKLIVKALLDSDASSVTDIINRVRGDPDDQHELVLPSGESVGITTPAFATGLDASAVEAALQRFVKAGWVSYYPRNKENVYHITKAGLRDARSASPDMRTANVQQRVIGAMIKLYRDGGLRAFPLHSALRFHHILALVRLTARDLGTLLNQWCKESTTFGPMALTLAEGIRFEDVTLTLDQIPLDAQAVENAYRLRAVGGTPSPVSK